MGIRESLERQQLEKQEALKLSDLNLEQEEKEEEGLRFDPEKEIPEKEKRKIIEQNKKDLEAFNINAFSNAYYIKNLLPNRFARLEIGKYKQHIERIFNLRKKRKRDMFFLIDCINAASLFPEYFNRLDINQYCAESIEALKEEFLEIKSRPRELAFFKIIYPERIHEFDLEKAWLIGYQELNLAREENRMYDVIEITSFLKIIFPERVNDLQLDDNKFKEIKKYIKKEQSSPDIKIWLYYNLAILAAQDLKFVDHRLELVMRKPAEFKPEKHKRPERRIN